MRYLPPGFGAKYPSTTVPALRQANRTIDQAARFCVGRRRDHLLVAPSGCRAVSSGEWLACRAGRHAVFPAAAVWNAHAL